MNAYWVRYNADGSCGSLTQKKLIKARTSNGARLEFWKNPLPPNDPMLDIGVISAISIVGVEWINPVEIRKMILRECHKRPDLAITPGSFVALLYDEVPEDILIQEIKWLDESGHLNWYALSTVRHYTISGTGHQYLSEPQIVTNSTKPGD